MYWYEENMVDDFEGLEIMQFTGRLDKNENDIYGGDIVKNESWGIRKIEWNNLEAKFKAISSKSGHWDIALSDMGIVEIIGNIYQNPELIN